MNKLKVLECIRQNTYLYKKLKKSIFFKLYCLPMNMYMNRRRKAVQKNGYEVINAVTSIAKEMGIDIWIDGGTLLGYVREGKLMEHDYDIDFAIVNIDEKKRRELITLLKKQKMYHVRHAQSGERIYEDAFEYRGIIFDIDYYFEEDSKLIYFEHDASFDAGSVITYKRMRGKKIKVAKGAKIYKFSSSEKQFVEGMFENKCVCLIPKNPVKRVREMYGENWEKPIKDNYVWTRDTINEYIGFDPLIKIYSIK